jgi:hypothetical protein
VGGTLTAGVIAQVNDTAEAKPPLAALVIVEEADFPAVIVFGESGLAVSWKPGTTAAMPVPVRATLWGLLDALSVMTRVPELVPTVAGVKVRLMVQVAEGANEGMHVFVSANAGEAVMLLKVSWLGPLLVSVTVCGPLVLFTVWDPN